MRNTITDIDNVLQSNIDSKVKNKLIKIRGKLLHNIVLNGKEVIYLKQMELI